jgi:hypothetical protein
MKRRLGPAAVLSVLAAMLLAPGVGAAQKTGCSAGESVWQLQSIEEAAAEFFPHLFPGQFATADEFADAITALVDRNGDGLACTTVKVFDNPNSHYYKLGIEVLGEPTQKLGILDNNKNGS